MSKKRFNSNFLLFVIIIFYVLFLYLWLWNPLEKEYDVWWYARTIIVAIVNVLISIMFFDKDQTQKEFKKNNAMKIKFYSLIILLSTVIYYLFISPANAVILGISLFITVLISGVCLFIYAKKKNNKNTVL